MISGTRDDERELTKTVSPPGKQKTIVSEAKAIAPPNESPIHVDDSQAQMCYANFCRVTGTPEELILDSGLNSNPTSASGPIEIKQRLVLNYFTAKRLLHALHQSIQRHELAFGVLETDVQKRVVLRPAMRASASAP